jgi:hypothetical protein
VFGILKHVLGFRQLYGLLRFASIFRFDVSGSKAPLRPYIRPVMRS